MIPALEGLGLTNTSAIDIQGLGQYGTQVDKLKAAADEGKEAEAAKAFESLLATMLVKELRSSLTEGFFGEGPGADVYEAWFDDHLGKALTENDALGFAGMVKASLGGRKEAAAEATGATQ